MLVKQNILREKSYAFSIGIINLQRYLEKKKEFIIGNQLVRSGLSIGANIEEGLHGESKKDFISKLSISLKESHETHYWLRLLKDTQVLKQDQAKSILNDAEEIIKILTAVIKSSKKDVVNS